MQNQQGASRNKSVPIPANWSSIKAYDRHLIRHAADRAFKDGKIVVLTGDSGVGKSVLANEICPDSLLEESAIRKAMLHDKPITAKAIPVGFKGELLIDEAQLLCKNSNWISFIDSVTSKEMKVLVITQQKDDLPEVFVTSSDVVQIHITKPIYR